ncbi:MAG: GNAT family N-acetyltransferase [Bryobacteraceae bacterium]|nr:GNAT family N-acetyltransferase [Bryobacteraceae bacterium]
MSSADPRWGEWLSRVPHDIYHTSQYHGVRGLGQEGEAFVFLHREGESIFLWPYLLVPIGAGGFDVTSVYGYGGPVASGDAEFVGRAWQALREAWRSLSVVSAFTRFHPLLRNVELVEGFGDRAMGQGLKLHGSTVSMDLTLPEAEQFGRYQKQLRNEIRRARSAEVRTREDGEWAHLEDFVRLYSDTMSRVHSRPEYLVDGKWVAEFRERLGSAARLFVTEWNGSIMAACLVMAHGPYLHAHLLGSKPEIPGLSPTKALLDGLRLWGTAQGYHSLHIGGGLGCREDSLFHAKRKFSPCTHEFYTGSWVLDVDRYRDLEAAHRVKSAAEGIEIGNPGYFPIYRYVPE